MRGKWTPGPWRADQRPVFGEWFVRQDPVNWTGMGYQFICALPADKKGTLAGDMFAANAGLIAAAPALYEALEQACEIIADLSRFANNNGAMIDDETFAEGLAALSLAHTEPSQGEK